MQATVPKSAVMTEFRLRVCMPSQSRYLRAFAETQRRIGARGSAFSAALRCVLICELRSRIGLLVSAGPDG